MDSIIKKSGAKSKQKAGLRNIIRKTAAIAACLLLACALCGCEVNEMSSLREFSRAYLGEYECVEATLAGRDLLGLCRFVHLTLGKDGTFTVSAKSKTGISAKKTGGYEYDLETEELIFTAEHGGKRYEKRVPLVKGAFTVTHSLGGRELVLKFRVKG